MLILIWFMVCIIFDFVHYILSNYSHSLKLFALITAISLFILNKFTKKNNI